MIHVLMMILSPSISAAVEPKTDLGLVAGIYTDAAENPSSCLAGDLELDDSEEGLTIRLGARAFVTGVKSGEFKSSWSGSDCTGVVRGSARSGRISHVLESVCQSVGSHTLRLTTEIEYSGDSFVYTRTMESGKSGEKPQVVTCRLRREASGSTGSK